jgi:hypothetical protein
LPGVVEARGNLGQRRLAGGRAGAPGAATFPATFPAAGPPLVTVAVIADPPCHSPSSELTNHDVPYFART